MGKNVTMFLLFRMRAGQGGVGRGQGGHLRRVIVTGYSGDESPTQAWLRLCCNIRKVRRNPFDGVLVVVAGLSSIDFFSSIAAMDAEAYSFPVPFSVQDTTALHRMFLVHVKT